MPETRQCTFCGNKIEPGTGKMYIKTDGKTFHFCSNKCQKNMIKMGRKDRETRWTVKYAQEKALITHRKKAAEKKPAAKKKVIRKKKAKE